MDDTKLEELEKACKKEKNHKVRIRMVADAWFACATCLWMRLPNPSAVPRVGSATGCAATTNETSKASGIFSDAGGSEEFCETSLRHPS